MSALICGSLAFDNIMIYDGKFADHILPDQLHILNISFLVPSMHRDFGGCAGNIAYALKLLGGQPLVMATVGQDGASYIERMRGWGISTQHVLQLGAHYTAQCAIMTDSSNNQITGFHPGAMAHAHLNTIDGSEGASLAIISPDGRQAMLDHAAQLHRAGIPFVFDPGQGLPMFNGDELNAFIDQAAWVTVNDYEAKLLSDRTGQSIEQISHRVRGVVVTLGERGCEVWERGVRTHVAPVQPTAVVDPTGCGDAWRGALLFGLERGWSLAQCAALGNRVGALKVAARGPQNYTLDFDPATLSA